MLSIIKKKKEILRDTVFRIDNVGQFNSVEFYTEIGHLVKIEIHTNS